MWFEGLVGFKEKNPEQVRNNLIVKADRIISKVNDKSYQFGRLEIPSLKELQENAPNIANYKSKISISEVVGNVQTLHQKKENKGALFQAASQFNLLEMVGPNVTPEQGIGIYEYDRTQGPACAIACGAGTIFRNYFVKLGEQIGQTSEHQVDCLKEIGKALENEGMLLWRMKNGYTIISQSRLEAISNYIENLDVEQYELLKRKLKIGLQWDAEVTIANPQQIVSQAYCSALPVAYSRIKSKYWEHFARLILKATYEAIFYAGLINFKKTGNPKLYLTLVGGGAFGNEKNWIFDAIEKTMIQFSNTPLDVKIVSYGHSNLHVKQFVTKFV